MNVQRPTPNGNAAGVRWGMMLFLAAIPLAGGCAGYQIGAKSLYRPDVRTVHVPIFVNESYRRYLGELLTEAVVKEIEATTPYKVVGPREADTILTGRILSIDKRPIALDANGNPRDIELAFNVSVTWIDARGVPVMPETSLPLSLFDGTFAASPDFIPEAGQSTATAELDAVQLLARQIVSRMQTPW